MPTKPGPMMALNPRRLMMKKIVLALAALSLAAPAAAFVNQKTVDSVAMSVPQGAEPVPMAEQDALAAIYKCGQSSPSIRSTAKKKMSQDYAIALQAVSMDNLTVFRERAVLVEAPIKSLGIIC